MAHGPNQRNAYRRRMSGETDYRRRLKLLRSKKPRAVVRVSNSQTVCQFTEWSAEGDLVRHSVSGTDLVKKYSWPDSMSTKTVSASYMVGFALGSAAKANGHSEAVLDIGLQASSPGSRVFAALKGMLDAGLDIPHGDSVIPSDERIAGEHLDGKVDAAMDKTRKSIEEAF